MRSSEPDALGDILFVQRKRLLEHASELPNLPLERLLIRPRETRIQKLPRNTLDGGRYRQAKGTKGLEASLGELTRMDSVDDGTGVFEWATLARAELASGPAGVNEPAVDLVFRHALCEHLGVAAWVEDDEGCAVAGGEGWDGF